MQARAETRVIKAPEALTHHDVNEVPSEVSIGPELVNFRELLVQKDAKKTVAFHAETMDVALLADECWQALISLSQPTTEHRVGPENQEARLELLNWVNEKWNSPIRREPKTPNHDAPKAVPQKGGLKEERLLQEAAIRSLTINVSQVCNLSCSYCAAGGDGTYGSKTKTPDLETTKALLTRLINAVPDGELFVLTFLGGEPLLHPKILRSLAHHAQLLSAGRDLRLLFDIVTNGTLINSATASLLASLNAHVTISIDGPPDDHDRARVTKSGKGSSGLVLKGLEELLKIRGNLGSLNVGAVFGKHNLNVVATWKYLAEFPFDSMKFDFAAEAEDDLNSREFAAQLVAVADLAFKKGGEPELRRIQAFDHLFRVLDDKVRIQNHCLAGKNHLQLDTDGKLTACQWFVGQQDEYLGHAANLDLSAQNSGLLGFAEPLVEKHGCGSCWARHICGGGCMHVNKVKTGNKHQVDQAFCERTRTILAKGIERYAESRYETTRGNSGEASEIYNEAKF
jgi:uncharacterized protein